MLVQKSPQRESSSRAEQLGDNQPKRKLAAGELVLCMGINQMCTPNIAMIAAACGFGAIYIDLEHNPTSLETVAAICVAALGIRFTPRVSSRGAHDAGRADVRRLRELRLP